MGVGSVTVEVEGLGECWVFVRVFFLVGGVEGCLHCMNWVKRIARTSEDVTDLDFCLALGD